LHCGLEEAPLAERFDIPLLYISPGLEGDTQAVARRVLAQAALAAGYGGLVSPSLPAALLSDLVTSTLLA
jgi:hypothetical protein